MWIAAATATPASPPTTAARSGKTIQRCLRRVRRLRAARAGDGRIASRARELEGTFRIIVSPFAPAGRRETMTDDPTAPTAGFRSATFRRRRAARRRSGCRKPLLIGCGAPDAASGHRRDRLRAEARKDVLAYAMDKLHDQVVAQLPEELSDADRDASRGVVRRGDPRAIRAGEIDPTALQAAAAEACRRRAVDRQPPDERGRA